jgi:hypothetical protein
MILINYKVIHFVTSSSLYFDSFKPRIHLTGIYKFSFYLFYEILRRLQYKDQLVMWFRKIIALYSDNHKKSVNTLTLWAKRRFLFMLKQVAHTVTTMLWGDNIYLETLSWNTHNVRPSLKDYSCKLTSFSEHPGHTFCSPFNKFKIDGNIEETYSSTTRI